MTSHAVLNRQSGKLLSRYVKKQALFAMIFAVLGLWLLQVVFSFLSELENISDTYSYVDALQYIAYRSPYFLEQFMPTGALLGAVVGLGLLANNSELVVMRSVGVSIYRIVGWVLQPAVLFVVLALVVNQFVLPKSNVLASQIRDPEVSLLASVDGYWTVQDSTVTDGQRDTDFRDIVFIDYADANGKLGEVKRWRIDADNNLTSVSQAESGRYADDVARQNAFAQANQLDKTYAWQLDKVTTLQLKSQLDSVPDSMTQSTGGVGQGKDGQDGIQSDVQDKLQGDVQTDVQSKIQNDNQRQSARLIASNQPLVTQTTVDNETAILPISPMSVHLLTRRAEDLSLTELYEFGRFNEAQNTRSLEHELTFWQKLLSPFAILSLVVVACSFVFGSLRTHSLGLRIVVALLFGLLFSYLQDLVGFISLATGVSPLLMVLLPIVASTVLGVYLLKKQG